MVVVGNHYNGCMASQQTTRSPGMAHLSKQIEYNQLVADQISESSQRHKQVLQALQHWQRARLDATYADLRSSDRYHAACEFFLDELYGGRDVAARDRQLSKAAPVMRRFLPDDLLGAVGDALRLQAMSLSFDFKMAGLMLEVECIDQPTYATAYCTDQDWAGRQEQLALIFELGHLLGETVQHAMVHRLIRMMRGPARLAGFGLLQSFLQEGLDAFATMGAPDLFLETINAREEQALEAMRSGELYPFRPWIGEGPEPTWISQSGS